jgi:hypothetical protein
MYGRLADIEDALSKVMPNLRVKVILVEVTNIWSRDDDGVGTFHRPNLTMKEAVDLARRRISDSVHDRTANNVQLSEALRIAVATGDHSLADNLTHADHTIPEGWDGQAEANYPSRQ